MIQFDSKKILSLVVEKYDAVHAAAAACKISAQMLRKVLRGGQCRLDAARKIIRHFKLVEGTDYTFAVATKAKKKRRITNDA